MYITNWVNSNK